MELNHLRYFYEVAKAGSFTKAAKALRVSQPSISKIVQILEDREGVRLFDRGKRGVSLTEEGRIFLDSCHCIFQEIENLKSTVKTQREDCVGDLSIGASDNLCNYIFPEIFIEFWKSHPRVRVNLLSGTSETIKSDLLDGRSELGVFYAKTGEPTLESERLGFVEFAIVHSPKNRLLSNAKRFDPRIFAQAYFIGSRINDYNRPYPTLAMLQSLGLKPLLLFETNSQETQKRMVLQGYGYSMLPKYMVQSEADAGELKIVKTPKIMGSDLHLVRKKGKTLSKPSRVFESFLREKLAEIF